MRKLLKAKFLILLFWIVVVFGSIATLPNLQSFVTNQVTKTTTTTTLSKQQEQWGHGLTGTKSLTLVFNNPAGKLTANQRYQIHKVLNNLNLKADYYGIKQLRTSDTMTNDHQLLTSNDGSTELAIAAVKTSNANLSIVADQLNSAVAVSGLNTAVTSPTLLSSQHTAHQLREAVSVFLIGSAVLLLVFGLIFRSLLVPLINLLIQTIVTITTMSLTTNVLAAKALPFTITSIVATGLVTLLVTSLLTWSYMHDYWAEEVIKESATATALATLKIQWKRWAIVLLPLIIICAALSFTGWVGLASAWSVIIALVVAGLATPTLNYAFTALLGNSIYWPGTHFWMPRARNLWGQMARFSHWRPLFGLVITAILLIPGLLNASAQYADDNLRPIGQTQLSSAELGQQLVTAHFGNGAADPITIMLASPKILTQQAQLQTLDSLTSKLKAVKNVAQVTSVTQPTGHKLTPFYVKHQLATINTDLLGKQTSVIKLQQQLATSQQDLQAAKTPAHAKTIDKLTTRINRVATTNDELLTQLTNLNTTLTSSKTVSRHIGQVNREFDQLTTTTDHLTDQLNAVADTQTTLINQGSRINSKVKAATKKLGKTTQTLQALLASLKVTSTYLSGLASSQIGDSFYLPANGQLNSRYQNSVFTNVSSDNHMTQLTVTLKTSPTSPASYQAMQTIQQVAKDSLLATPLAHATVTSSGITSQQTAHHQLIRTHAVKWALLGLSVIALCLWIGLGSFTLSVLLTLGATLTLLASWGWTQLITNQWFHMGLLSSNVFIWGFGILLLHWLVITMITVNRRHWLRAYNAVDLRRHFYLAGQMIWPFSVFELAYLLPLLLMTDQNLRAFGLLALIGIAISNLIAPLCLPGLITWTVHPPKLAWLRGVAKHRQK